VQEEQEQAKKEKAAAKLKKEQLAQRKKEAKRLGINVEGAHNTHMAWPTTYATHHGSTESCRCVDLPIPEETEPAENIVGPDAAAGSDKSSEESDNDMGPPSESESESSSGESSASETDERDSEGDSDKGSEASDEIENEDADEEKEEDDPVMVLVRTQGLKLLELVNNRGNSVQVEMLLHGIGDMTTQLAVANFQEDAASLPPLHRAARAKASQLCASLLMYGAEMESTGPGFTPLQAACLPPYDPVWTVAPTEYSTDLPTEFTAKTILDSGADPNSKDWQGLTVIQLVLKGLVNRVKTEQEEWLDRLREKNAEAARQSIIEAKEARAKQKSRDRVLKDRKKDAFMQGATTMVRTRSIHLTALALAVARTFDTIVCHLLEGSDLVRVPLAPRDTHMKLLLCAGIGAEDHEEEEERHQAAGE
jgi:hypothetical protein